MKTSDIRSSFLDYFRKNGHSVQPSSSLVPQNDQTLLFTNAGMVQFKDIFVGLEKREYTRATTSQKCVRAGGKHNDLDQVGFTARHHTFFEMLGNFSFGDYFKEDAISFAWNFITKELGLDKSRLLATVYHTDEEAKNIWQKVAGSDFQIIPISTNDNFWSMGDTGPCGPCTEIFYDHGSHIFGGVPGSPDEDGDRFVEIWNLVFMQYEQFADGRRVELKAKSIDTGMGLERIAAVMQGKCDNYDIDLFQNIMSRIQEESNVQMTPQNKSSFKVIADHLRSLSFLIADGVFPSNEGRGYVLRRILRRAVRHANLIGVQDSFIYKLVPCLVDLMKDAYPELDTMQQTISSTIKLEEDKFMSTIENGLDILSKEARNIQAGGVLDGRVAFKLYDTYGFPLDLTEDILKSKGISVDEAGFNEAMHEQKNRANWKNSSYEKGNDAVFFDIANKVSSTFVGYDKLSTHSVIRSIVMEGQEINDSSFDTKLSLITEVTPFYAESGGQVGDVGIIENKSGVFIVEDTRKVGSLIVHEGHMEKGKLSVGDNVALTVNKESRQNTAAHHTGTHLLQAALRKVLGTHVSQKGSHVCKDYLQFDFSHNAAMTQDEVNEVTRIINQWILSNLPVIPSIMSKEEAVKSGATALFGEKYGQEVRVINIYDGDVKVSSELCGGTHVQNTGSIGLLKIVSESSIGSGLRRIRAVAGNAFLLYADKLQNIVDYFNENLKASYDNVTEKFDAVVANAKSLSLELSKTKVQLALQSFMTENINGVQLKICKVDDISFKDMRSVMNSIQGSCVGVIYSVVDGKVNVLITSGVSNIAANRILEHAMLPLNGTGGGKPGFAQGAGSNPSAIDSSCNEVRKFIKSL